MIKLSTIHSVMIFALSLGYALGKTRFANVVLLAVLVAMSSSLGAQSAPEEGWESEPTKDALMERLKQRDAAFGDYLIEFNVTQSRQRHPLREWYSTNWKTNRPPAPSPKSPEDLDPPHLELAIRRYLFATHADEEHMDWHITEVRKDGEKAEKEDRIGQGARFSTWGETVRSEYYKVGEEKPANEIVYEGDPRVPRFHKNSSTVSPTILNDQRMHFELIAGIGMSKRIQQIDQMEIKDGLLRVSGKMKDVFNRESEFEMDLTPSLLPRRLTITFPQQMSEHDGAKAQRKIVLQTEGELRHKATPATPAAAKFESAVTIVPAEGKTWVRSDTKFDRVKFVSARGRITQEEFLKMARLKPNDKSLFSFTLPIGSEVYFNTDPEFPELYGSVYAEIDGADFSAVVWKKARADQAIMQFRKNHAGPKGGLFGNGHVVTDISDREILGFPTTTVHYDKPAQLAVRDGEQINVVKVREYTQQFYVRFGNEVLVLTVWQKKDDANVEAVSKQLFGNLTGGKMKRIDGVPLELRSGGQSLGEFPESASGNSLTEPLRINVENKQ